MKKGTCRVPESPFSPGRSYPFRRIGLFPLTINCPIKQDISYKTVNFPPRGTKAIHYNSPRAGRNFVIVDCTALPETLVENVLFGHARGSSRLKNT